MTKLLIYTRALVNAEMNNNQNKSLEENIYIYKHSVCTTFILYVIIKSGTLGLSRIFKHCNVCCLCRKQKKTQWLGMFGKRKGAK